MSIRDRLKAKLGRIFGQWRKETSLHEKLSSVGHLLTGSFLGSLIGLIAFTLTARALGVVEYGMLALCFSYTRAIERIISFQSWQPLIKYGAGLKGPEGDADLKSLLKFGLCLDVAAASLSWLIAVVLAFAAGSILQLTASSQQLLLAYCTVLLFQVSDPPWDHFWQFRKALLPFRKPNFVLVDFLGQGIHS